MRFGDLRGNQRVAQITGPFCSSMGLACGPFPPHWLLLSVAGTEDMLLLFALLSSADLSAMANLAVVGPHVCKDTNARNPSQWWGVWVCQQHCLWGKGAFGFLLK